MSNAKSRIVFHQSFSRLFTVSLFSHLIPSTLPLHHLCNVRLPLQDAVDECGHKGGVVSLKPFVFAPLLQVLAVKHEVNENQDLLWLLGEAEPPAETKLGR